MAEVDSNKWARPSKRKRLCIKKSHGSLNSCPIPIARGVIFLVNTAQDELEGGISLFTTPSFNRNQQGRFIEASARPGCPFENENPAGSKFLSKRIPCEIFSYLSFRFIKKKKKEIEKTPLFSNLPLFFPFSLFSPPFWKDFIFEIIDP